MNRREMFGAIAAGISAAVVARFGRVSPPQPVLPTVTSGYAQTEWLNGDTVTLTSYGGTAHTFTVDLMQGAPPAAALNGAPMALVLP